MATNPTGNSTADTGAVPESAPKGGTAGVDLDSFLSLVESRLRNPFSSLELSRLLTSSKTTSANHVSSSAGGAADTSDDATSKEADNVIILGRVFDRMAKPVKLRSIVGLMGLEGSFAGASAGTNSDVGGTCTGNENLKKAIWDILSRASVEDGGDGAVVEDAALGGATNDVSGQPDVEDEWVRVLASLVQSAMFYRNEPTQAEEERCTKHLESVAEDIIHKICEEAAASASAAAGASSEGRETNAPASGSTSKKANFDPMHFVPQSLALLPPTEVKVCIPESAFNNDFTVNADAPILSIDADVEQSRADEETKELENRERIHRMAQQQQKMKGIDGGSGSGSGSGAAGAGGRGIGAGGRNGATGRGIASRSALGAGRGGRGRGRQSAGGPDTASLFIRSKKPTASTATLGRGTARALLGRGRGSAGPGGDRGAAGRGRGIGRGSAAAAVGKSLGVPTKKPIAMVSTSNRPVGKVVAAGSGPGGAVATVGGAAAGNIASTLKGRAGRAMKASAGGMGGRSKMMMIDSAEVEKLNKEKQAAAAEEAAPTTGKSRKRKIMEAAAAEEAAKRSKSIAGSAVPAAPAGPSPSPAQVPAVPAQPAAAAPDTNITPVATMPAASATGAAAVPDGLLSKSNKLSSADRSRVERFFSDRFNPTPDQTTYKMKLNEERSSDAETGQSIKETLYLELDYSTFGYKKTRKIKKK
jgi:hypothetical protein